MQALTICQMLQALTAQKHVARNSDSFSKSCSIIQWHSVAFSFKRTCSCSLLLLPRTIAAKLPRSLGRLGMPAKFTCQHKANPGERPQNTKSYVESEVCFPLAWLKTENLSSQTNSRIRACIQIGKFQSTTYKHMTHMTFQRHPVFDP